MELDMNKKLSILFNSLIIIFELFGFIITRCVNGRFGIEYYTVLSNFLMLISSSMFIFYVIFNKKTPIWLNKFKYMTTVCVSITFFVVIIVLAPMYNFNYLHLLFHNELLYLHLLCPVLSIITFIYFDDLGIYNNKDCMISSSATLAYGIILSVLNILKLIVGPYPFLMVYNQTIIESIVWFITIIGISYVIGILLIKLYNSKRKKV